MNPYDILHVDKNATDKEIKESFKNLAKKNHPDKKGDESEMQKINMAYSILKDPEKRKHFDEFGNDKFNNKQDKITKNIAELLNIIIENSPSDINYFLDELRKQTVSQKEKVKNELNSKIKKIEKIRNRIIKEGENKMVLYILDDNIRQLENSLKLLNTDIGQKLQAIDIVREYDFEIDDNEPFSFSMGFSGGLNL